ncbi:MAG: hypothetical protein PHV30_04165 [Candidatus Margulisbacteria bacterium]|nr:hypothetical protein [Candidatus Margulisiibacteriota bacterium]
MSKLNEIQEKLRQVEGGLFQKVCDAVISQRGLGNVIPNGSKDGSDKTVKGTPDSYIQLENDEFIFIEHTTQQDNLLSKVLEDIKKCFDVKKTGIEITKINKIIYCHNSKLEPKEVTEIIDLCTDNSCDFEQITSGSISFKLAFDYPLIAKDLLDISVDTRQILTPNEFSKIQSKILTFENEFLFRESEIKNIINALSLKDILVIKGKPGVGKSRIAIEAVNKFVSQYPDFSFFCIDNQEVSLFEDLKRVLSQNPKLILLVDDANRISQLTHILSQVLRTPGSNVLKLVLTVRDYAVDEVSRHLQEYSWEEITINSLERNEIKAILNSKTVDIHNHIFVDRICDFSHGNPRLAILASNAVKEKNSFEPLINIYSLQKILFSNLEEKLRISENKNRFTTLAIICFFRAINAEKDFVQEIYRVFNISEADFWDSVYFLHTLEIVNLYDKQICKISDQLLATYFFYELVFTKEAVSFDVFLNHFFLSNSKRMKDVLIPIANSFDIALIKRKCTQPVKNLFSQILDNKDISDLFLVSSVFFFVIPDKVLSFLARMIEIESIVDQDICFETNHKGVDEKIYNLLNKFTYLDKTKIKISIQLACRYFIKRKDLAPQFSEYITYSFEYEKLAHLATPRQQLLLETLIEEAKIYNEIGLVLLHVAPFFLKLEHMSSTADGHKIYLNQMGLPFTEPIKEVHKIIFDFVLRLDSLRLNDFLNDYIKELSSNMHGKIEEIKAALLYDSEYIKKLIEKHSIFSSFETCQVIQEYIELLKRFEVDIANFQQIEKCSHTDLFALSRLISFDAYERRVLFKKGLSYNEIEKKRKEDILNNMANFSLTDYKSLYSQLIEIYKSNSDRDHYILGNFMFIILNDLIKDKNLFLNFISYIVDMNNSLKVDLYVVIVNFLNTHLEDHKSLFEIVSKQNYNIKSNWMLAFWVGLPKAAITDEYIKRLLDYFNSVVFDYGFIDYEFLIKYDNIQTGIAQKILQTLYNRRSENNCSFCYLFVSTREIGKQLFEVIKDKNLINELWLFESIRDLNFDYDGTFLKKLIELDCEFIIKHLQVLTDTKEYLFDSVYSREYSFIWGLPNSSEILNKIIEFFLQKKSYYLDNHYINVFFLGKHPNEEYIEKKMEFIKQFIIKNSDNTKALNLIFIPVKKCFQQNIYEFIQTFLNVNNKVDNFKKLDFEPHLFSGSGDFISSYQDVLSFWEGLLMHLNDVKWINHSQYVSEKIQDWQQRIIYEQKRAFLKDEDY